MRFFLLLSLIFTTVLSAQTNYSILSINDSLKENANAVVRLDETIVEITAKNKMEVTNHRVITILKKAGESSINPYAFYSSKTKITDILAHVYNEQGEEIEKIKRKDFIDISAVDGGTLYGDSRVKVFRYTPTSYPYTVDFSYTYTTPNTAFLPRWMPIDDYMVSVEKSVFNMQIAESLKWRKKEKNFDNYVIINRSSESLVSYEMNQIPAQKREALSPSFYYYEPQLMVALEEFHLEGVDGFATDWESMGNWQYNSLLSNRDKLPESTVSLMKEKLTGITDREEKIKKVYEYVQNNTRYISVQLGIGGWQPISAEEVDRVKYGDCKGLTNYTKALLKSQGIESFYSVVHAGQTKLDMEKDFAIMQGNHVILNVPNEENDIWLECTSQKIPFGFLSDFTDDRDVLVVTPEGGKIKHTQSYLNDENSQITTGDLVLDNVGDIKANLEIKTYGLQYDKHSQVVTMSGKDQNDYYTEYWNNINALELEGVVFDHDKKNVYLSEKIKVSAQSYVTKIGDNLLFKPNAFNVSKYVPSRYTDRKLSFEIDRGYTDSDEISIKLPVDFKLGKLPDPVVITSEFGNYEMAIQLIDKNRLKYTRKIQLKNGLYDKSKYDDYRNFRKKVKKYDNIKIVLNR
ncbi:DUF3857 domain-containing protein [Maribacter sp. 1_MG-2023]|uniref:DUF3857 domain-containing protein n=1 Tax=Maribacter sp. 1_MG-2023 TaxID=3062677 RepID=UPI0026E26BC7|nr:DUF3857 domain-containing protein [Maribacter sp. 1_MG-2023]MDO6472900.1 DUF3857 domain-containing protein [Maribacter sp. 1_MG-2023]